MGLVGGLMIGLAASLYLLGNGRIMGASGIIGGLVDMSERSSAGDRISFFNWIDISTKYLHFHL